MDVRRRFAVPFLLLGLAAVGHAADFGHPGGPVPEGVAEVDAVLRQDPYDLELMLSFGTSKMGSAGHLAVAVRDGAGDDDLVYSANFYADRKPEHQEGYYTADLMCRIPKREYLFATTSSLGPDASFGLDMGEVYKRSVVSVRVYGVEPELVAALTGYWDRINEDYRGRAEGTEYHDGPVLYDYMGLNCAKTIAVAFRHGLKWRDVRVKGSGVLAKLNPVAPTKANVPMETTLDIMEALSRRGYRMDVVLYKKYPGSTYVNPHDAGGVAYRDLPDRFPSVLSLDYRQDQGHYEDYDNLRAMYLMFHLGRHAVRVDEETSSVEIERSQEPLPYDEADEKASAAARKQGKGILRRVLFRTWGLRIGEQADQTHLYHFGDGSEEP